MIINILTFNLTELRCKTKAKREKLNEKSMTTKRVLTLLVVVFFCVNNLAKSQFTSYSNEFLNIGVDAGSLAQGGAITSSISGVYSGYWNPAGLVNSAQRLEIAAMHANYFSGLAQYDYLGASYRLSDSLALGVSAIRFGVDNIPNTLNMIDENGNVNYDRISYFSVADYAFLFSLAKKSRIVNLSWGASLKIIYRRQGQFANAYGFGFDLGVQYSMKKWLLGANLRDASSTFNIWIFDKKTFETVFENTDNKIPENSLEISSPKLIMGVAREFKINKQIALSTEIDFDINFDGKKHAPININPISLIPHIGLEIRYLQNIYLRAGVSNFQVYEDFDNSNQFTFQPNIGVGISFFNFSLDYALTNVGDMTISPMSHIFSLKYKFPKIHK